MHRRDTNLRSNRLDPESRRGSLRSRLDRCRATRPLAIERLEDRALLSTLEVAATITADNHYALYLGQADGSQLILVGSNEPGLEGNPGSFNWSLPETWNFSVGEGAYLYVVAWDDGGPQMWSGQFMLSDGNAIFSNTTAWVCTVASGPNPTTSGGVPSLATVASDIASAVWSAPSASAPQGSSPWFAIPGLSPDAQFVWHDTLGSTSSSDDHYVVFRTIDPLMPIVPNAPPDNLQLNLSASTIDENGTVTLEGVFTDPDSEDTHTVIIDWGSGEESSTLDLPEGVSSFRISHQYRDDAASGMPGTPADVYSIAVTVTDPEGTSTSGGTSITVNNVAPVITTLSNGSASCGGTTTGEEVAVSGTFADVGTLDTHSAEINWGDGVTTSGEIDSQSITGHHTYSVGGIYTITVTVSDDDGGVSSSAITTSTITGVGVIDGVLYVIGTDQVDHVTLNREGNGLLKVHADFLSQGNFITVRSAEVQRIVVALCDGNNQLNVAGNMQIGRRFAHDGNYVVLDAYLQDWTGRQNSAANTSSGKDSNNDAVDRLVPRVRHKSTSRKSPKAHL